MTYSVKEIFFTLQGEGANAGRAAVFLRFSGCNLWTGREADREDAACDFCDTEFVGTDGPEGDKYTSPEALSRAVRRLWPFGQTGAGSERRPLVVCTGGEPLLQLDPPLIAALKAAGFEIAVETNGTLKAPDGIDWLCVSPKHEAPFEQKSGDELKLVYPQPGSDPAAYAGLDFQHFFLQPMDGPERGQNTIKALEYCADNPQWRISLQAHKYMGIP